jgi:hypothetical protein
MDATHVKYSQLLIEVLAKVIESIAAARLCLGNSDAGSNVGTPSANMVASRAAERFGYSLPSVPSLRAASVQLAAAASTSKVTIIIPIAIAVRRPSNSGADSESNTSGEVLLEEWRAEMETFPSAALAGDHHLFLRQVYQACAVLLRSVLTTLSVLPLSSLLFSPLLCPKEGLSRALSHDVI